MGPKGYIIRERYNAAAEGYDELYGGEQVVKYDAVIKLVRPRGTVLDAGCGTGLLLEYLAVKGFLVDVDKYICLDYSSRMLEIARGRVSRFCWGVDCHLVLANVENIPLADKSVDVTYSITVLDLVDDPASAIREMLRVTKGPVIVSLLARLETWRRFPGKVAGFAGNDVLLLFNK